MKVIQLQTTQIVTSTQNGLMLADAQLFQSAAKKARHCDADYGVRVGGRLGAKLRGRRFFPRAHRKIAGRYCGILGFFNCVAKRGLEQWLALVFLSAARMALGVLHN